MLDQEQEDPLDHVSEAAIETTENYESHQSLISEGVEENYNPVQEGFEVEDLYLATKSKTSQAGASSKEEDAWEYKPPPNQDHPAFENASESGMDSEALPLNTPLRSPPRVISNGSGTGMDSEALPLNTPLRSPPRIKSNRTQLEQSHPISTQVSGVSASIDKYEPPPGHRSSQNSQSQQIQTSVNNTRQCSNCNMQIILGEREKDHVAFLGKQIFSIWKRIFEEIDEAKKLMYANAQNSLNRLISDPKFSSDKMLTTASQFQNTNASDTNSGGNGCVCGATNNQIESQQETTVQLKGRNTIQAIVSPEIRDDECPIETTSDSQFWIAQMEKNKRDFIEAFERICNSISQAKDKRQNIGSSCNPNPLPGITPDKSASATVPDRPIRHHSLVQRKDTVTDACPNSNSSPNAVYEKKFKEIIERLDTMELKTKGLDQQVGEVINTLSNQNPGVENRIKKIETDVLHLSKLIHELQCVTKLQMHCGGLDNTR